jgi:two-component system, chemotaxis family, sensor kinase CheA
MELDHDTILQTFLVESDELLAAMEEDLVGLEARPGDQELINRIFRSAHTLKGNSASLGFPKLVDCAHSVEDLLDRIRQGGVAVNEGIISLLLSAVDTLRQMVSAAVAGCDGAALQHVNIVEQLRHALPARIPSPRASDRSRGPGRRREDIQSFVERAKTLRVDIGKLDRLLDLTSETAIARGRLLQLLEACGQEDLIEAYREMDHLFLDLQELVMKVRMVPIGPTFRQYLRTVRDIAVGQGKQARLVMEGEDVELDTTVIEHLKDPLTHMVRNALDHGIESPVARVAAGKDPCGVIALKACHESGNIVIEVSDDGAGLDRAAILKRARGRARIADSDALSDAEIDRLIFEPGFSTSETVTDMSGRGVGLDVVRRKVESLRGTLAVDSQSGKGTTITIRLPLTLAIIEGFGVNAANETYLIPLDAVVECIELGESARRNGVGVVNLRGAPLPYLRLRDHFALPGKPPEREQVVVLQHARGQAGLAVDTILGERQTVIKPLGRFFKALPGVAGCAILGNGRVALILDVEGLVHHVLEMHESQTAL